MPIKLPAVDIHSVGSGGGSIASVDAGGVLHVGPASAGADPGPAAYGRGGTEATTTDAQIVLGRLDVELWERLYGWPLLPEAADDAVRRRVAEPLDVDVVAAANAVLAVTISNLVDAIRLVSVQRGYDPREFTLAAYGGAGPMYAIDVARALEIPEVIIPPTPGVTSALGLLQVDLAAHAQRSILVRQSLLDAPAVTQLFRELEEEARVRLGSGDDVTVARQADVRYFGQSRYMTIDAPDGPWNNDATAAVVDVFNAAHEREYGYTMPPAVSEVELVDLRVLVSAHVDRLRSAVPAAVSPRARRGPAARSSPARGSSTYRFWTAPRCHGTSRSRGRRSSSRWTRPPSSAGGGRTGRGDRGAGDPCLALRAPRPSTRPRSPWSGDR